MKKKDASNINLPNKQQSIPNCLKKDRFNIYRVSHATGSLEVLDVLVFIYICNFAIGIYTPLSLNRKYLHENITSAYTGS